MRIGVDARELAGQPTGVGRYLSGLVGEWAANGAAERHEFMLYAHQAIPSTLDLRRFVTRIVPGSPGTWWEQVQLPRAASKDHLDLFLAARYAGPILLPTPTVVVIYDVSFAAHPEWFRRREGLRLRWLSRRSAARARAVVTISEFSRREIVEHLDVPDGRIHVIPPGLIPRSPALAGAREPRVLFVGSIFNRRHVTDLIRAFAPIARAGRGASLDLVGDNRSYPYEDLASLIDREGLREQVRWHQYTTDEELAGLFRQARAFAFLSEYEGLGLTPLEAIASGIPPVVLDTPVARESCGEAALLVRPGSLPAITNALELVLFDEPTRARLLAAGPAVLARYSWPRAAREILAVLEQC